MIHVTITRRFAWLTCWAPAVVVEMKQSTPSSLDFRLGFHSHRFSSGMQGHITP